MFPWFALAVAQAQTIHAVPHDYLTVAAAVTAASPGDIIEVDALADWTRDAGEDVWIEKELTIRGKNGDPVLPRITALGASLTLQSVKVQGVGRNQDSVGQDVALLASGAELTLLDVQIISRPLGGGYGVVTNDSTVWAERVTGSGLVTGPPLTVLGGRLDVRESAFENNLQGSIATSNADVDIQRTTFYGNFAYVGSDVLVDNDDIRTLYVKDSQFEFSSGSFGSAIFANSADTTLVDTEFLDSFAFGSGGAVSVFGQYLPVKLDVSGCTFSGGQAETGGALVAVNVRDSVIADSSFSENSAAYGGAMHVAFGDLEVKRTNFTGNHAVWTAGAILLGAEGDTYVDGSTYTPPPYSLPPTTGTGYTTTYTWPTGFYDQLTAVRLEQAVVEGVAESSDALFAGCLYGDVGVDLEVVESSFKHCDSDVAGGAIGFVGDYLAVHGTVLRDNSSGWGGAIDMQGGTLLVQDSVLTGNEAGLGAAIRAGEVDASLVRTAILDNHAGGGGVVELGNLWGFHMHGSRVCGNSSESTGAIVNATGGDSPGFSVTNSVFMDNGADLGAALRYVPADWLGNNGPPLAIHNNDFLENGVSSAVIVKGQVDFTNNIVAGHPIGFLLDSAPWGNALSGGYNLWLENAQDAAGTESRFPGTGAVLDQDPAFQGYQTGNCTSNLWLMAESPARLAGDPSILNVDGSRSDIGAYGGPNSGLVDEDGDGFLEDLDCDDTEPTTHPGGIDIPYDGVDNDCDGADLCDGDGDGFDAEQCGGNDCDDTNDQIHPRAQDVPDDGIDNNCDEFEPRTWVGGGGGCGCDQGGAPSPAWLALVGLLALRRRDRTLR